MPTEQILLRLPGDLVRRLRQAVPVRERSAFIARLLEQALPAVGGDGDPLYLAALAVEQDTAPDDGTAEWDAATIGDGLTGKDP